MKMHSLLIAGLFAVHGAGAYAADFDPPSSAQASGGAGLTRAEVKAETLRAIRAGEVTHGDIDYPTTIRPAAAPTFTRSRAEVKAETRQALAAGDITFGDAVYPKPETSASSGVTRAQVKGELLRAIAAHELHFSDTAYPDSGIVTTPRAKRPRAPTSTTAMAKGMPTT